MTRTTDRTMFSAAAVAAAVIVALIPVQITAFVLSPPPSTVEGWYALFATSVLRGMVAMDALYLVNNLLLVVVLLGLHRALARADPALALYGLVSGLISVAVYLTTNKGLELADLAARYATAGPAEQGRLLAAGQTLLAEASGTAFAVYYVLGGVSITLFAVILVRTGDWGTAAAWTALASGVLMLVPSTAGTVGLVFSLLSLIPWTWFSVLAVRRFAALRHLSPAVAAATPG